MEEESKSEMQCTEFEMLLPDAADGTLQGGELSRFNQHRSGCEACATLFAETVTGREWLHGLEEVEMPEYLVRRILIATSGVEAKGAEVLAMQGHPGLGRRFREMLKLIFTPLMTPRFAGTAAMAFFSISLLINVTGFRLSDLRARTLSHSYYAAENRAIKFYENMRFVYQIQNKVRSFRHSPEDGAGEERHDSSPAQPRNSTRRDAPPSHDEQGDGESTIEPWITAAAITTFNMPALGGPGMRGRNQ